MRCGILRDYNRPVERVTRLLRKGLGTTAMRPQRLSPLVPPVYGPTKVGPSRRRTSPPGNPSRRRAGPPSYSATFSHFFRRNLVISCCWFAASGNSTVSSFCSLRRKIWRISLGDLPVAHTMKMRLNFCS